MAGVSARISWRGDEVSGNARAAGMQALFRGGEDIVKAAGAIVPHDTGDLESDTDVVLDDSEGAVYVSYGNGPASAYAEAQHENESFQHPNGREAKFLEKALESRGDTVMDFVADAIRRELGM